MDGSTTGVGVSRGSAFFDGKSRKPSFGAVRGWSVTASRSTSALVEQELDLDLALVAGELAEAPREGGRVEGGRFLGIVLAGA